jgi:predicted membrane chloride channel (bestrophin family)
MWGSLLNRSRDTARLAATWIHDDVLMGRTINWLVATAIAHKQNLRGEKSVEEFAGLITEEEANGVLSAGHIVLAAMDNASEQLRLAAKAGAYSRATFRQRAA